MANEEKAKTAWHSGLHHNVLIVWKPEYNLGIPVVDEQHRGIVSTINSLYYGLQNKHGDNMLKPVIGMIYEYTYLHFDIEEDFLKKCEFPELEHHQELHMELKDTVFKTGKSSLSNQDPYEFMEFLKKWWIDHICDKDRVFRDYLASRQ